MGDMRCKKDKIALVTGAGRGIGNAFARRLAQEGATVIAVDRLPAPDLAQALRDAGAAAADFHQIDISQEDGIAALAGEVLGRYGRCDIIVNNAATNEIKPLVEITLADWRRMMAVNAESVFLICRAFTPSMIKQGYGRIINMASNTLGLVVTGFPHYVASKGTVVGFTRAIASELGVHGITANCIAPGLTKTPITSELFPQESEFESFSQGQAIKRVEVPEDLVGAMSFLSSDDAAFISGQTIIVDGGLIRNL